MSGFDLLSSFVAFIGGFLAAVGSKIFIKFLFRPVLEITEEIISVPSYAEFIDSNKQIIKPIEINRIKIRNKGKMIAAKNVCGIIKSEYDRIESRLSWYEGYEGGKSSITINAGDHAFLNVYGIILEDGKLTHDICIATENGWKGLTEIVMYSGLGDVNFELRITAENVWKPVKKSFKIINEDNTHIPHTPLTHIHFFII